MPKPLPRRRPKIKQGSPPNATLEIAVDAWDRNGDRSRPNIRGFLLVAVAGGLVMPAARAAAQTTPTGVPRNVVAVGVGVAPKFDGSDERRTVPLAFGHLNVGDVEVQFRGLQVRADVLPDSRLAFGPVISGRGSRHDADGAVGLLPELDTAVEAGAFIGYRFGGDNVGQGSITTELSLVSDVSDVHDGVLMTASANYAAVRKPDYSLLFDVQATWADAHYTQTYFGVDPVDARPSGLAAYRPGAGIRDIGAGVTAAYWFNRSLGVMGRVGASYLVGDAADSPVTKDGGRWQPITGVSLSYRF